MRVFLTGATGFIGGRLAEKLLARGHEVVALVRDPARARILAQKGIRLVQGDLSDPESLRTAMEGAGVVFHLAAWYEIGARDRSMAHRTNVDGTRHVLEAMAALGVPRGVYTSSLAVFSDTRGRLVDETYRYDGPHLSTYDLTKWKAHYEVALPRMEAGLPLTIVQPGVVYGPGDASPIHRFFVQYLERTLPAVPTRTAYCWSHVEDVADAHVLAWERGRPGESYIIAGPPHTLVEAVEIAREITGVPPPSLRLAPWALRLASVAASPFARWLPAEYHPETLRVSAGTTYLGDNGKARSDLGYEPRSLRTGLRQTLPHEIRRLGIDVRGAAAT